MEDGLCITEPYHGGNCSVDEDCKADEKCVIEGFAQGVCKKEHKWCLNDKDCKNGRTCLGVSQDCYDCPPTAGYVREETL